MKLKQRFQRWCHLMKILLTDMANAHQAIDITDSEEQSVIIGCSCRRIWP